MGLQNEEGRWGRGGGRARVRGRRPQVSSCRASVTLRRVCPTDGYAPASVVGRPPWGRPPWPTPPWPAARPQNSQPCVLEVSWQKNDCLRFVSYRFFASMVANALFVVVFCERVLSQNPINTDQKLHADASQLWSVAAAFLNLLAWVVFIGRSQLRITVVCFIQRTV